MERFFWIAFNLRGKYCLAPSRNFWIWVTSYLADEENKKKSKPVEESRSPKTVLQDTSISKRSRKRPRRKLTVTSDSNSASSIPQLGSLDSPQAKKATTTSSLNFDTVLQFYNLKFLIKDIFINLLQKVESYD